MIKNYKGYEIVVGQSWGRQWVATITGSDKNYGRAYITERSNREDALSTARAIVDIITCSNNSLAKDDLLEYWNDMSELYMEKYYSAAQAEPSPTAGDEDVLPKVLADVQARADMGKNKYGTLLQTFNGRCAVNDAKQELIDLLFYVEQHEMELDKILDDVTRVLELAIKWTHREEVRDTIQLVLNDLRGWRTNDSTA